jgi:GlpG protein
MRQAGTLSNRDHAKRLVDYLLTQGIVAKFDPEGDSWAIWIRDEDQLARAKELLREFAADPDSEKYRSVDTAAETLRKQQAADDARRMKNVVEMRNRWANGYGARPVTVTLMAISVLVSLATHFGKDNNAVMQATMFQSVPPEEVARGFPPTATYDIDHGQLWRLVTPMFLHFSPLHLIFNLSAIYYLGTVLEARIGSMRYVLLVLFLAAISNYGQYFFSYELKWEKTPTIRFGGLSGVVYGLFGYVWMKSRFDPFFGLRIKKESVVVMMAFFLLCWTGAIGSIANWAHTAGLVGGMAIAIAPVVWRNTAHRR